MSNELAKVENNVPVSIFNDIGTFEAAQRMAKPLSVSQLLPQQFRGKLEDCIIALDMAKRMGASPLAVLQNMYIVYGKPAWSSQFLIATVNASGKFSPLRYKTIGTRGTDSFGCIAWAKDKLDGEVLESPAVTIEMAKKEGWYTKNGSKWQTMPELMLRYRSATLFARTYCPELTMGIKTDDEVFDIAPVVTEAPLENKSRFEKAPRKVKHEPAQVVEVVEEQPKEKESSVQQHEQQQTLFPLAGEKEYVENAEKECELQIDTWLHDNEPTITLGQVKARCGHDNIPFHISMLDDDANGLRMIVKLIKGV